MCHRAFLSVPPILKILKKVCKNRHIFIYFTRQTFFQTDIFSSFWSVLPLSVPPNFLSKLVCRMLKKVKNHWWLVQRYLYAINIKWFPKNSDCCMQMVAVSMWSLVRLYCSIACYGKRYEQKVWSTLFTYWFIRHLQKLKNLPVQMPDIEKARTILWTPPINWILKQKLIYLTVMCCFLVDTNSQKDN